MLIAGGWHMLKVALVGGIWLAVTFFCAHVWITVAVARERRLRRTGPGIGHHWGERSAVLADPRALIWQLENDPASQG